MESKTFALPLLNNAAALAKLEGRISGIPGVTRVQGDVDTKVIGVIWDEPASWAQIEDVVLSMGYVPIYRHDNVLFP